MSSPKTPRPLKKILIANRGEIAVRVMRTCRELGIATVAVYSEADRGAVHVRTADEAYFIGPPAPRESYLHIEKIIAVAKRAGVDGIHPGYGFLSEKAEFAKAVTEAGITFIGPPADAIEAMGSKTRAREHMIRAGVPVVPGDNGPEGRGFATAEEALAAARRIGFPIMLKAANGGGGKGMRLVEDEKGFIAAYQGAQREALSAFGDGTVYLEKAIIEPRHIEVQVFGDMHGNVVHLCERDCSIQRRHQKVIEEAPSPVVTPSLRADMGEVACRAAKAVGYVGAGTCEFLFSEKDNKFYFLEMNTRLQVEHPVTEMITQLDLVRLQIEVAEGKPLPFKQADVVPHGAAIECRVYAEDPIRFLPSPGTIRSLRVPNGPYVRDDSGVVVGSEISVFYDPMISKLVVWGATREQAIDRMARALSEYHVGGIKTNLPFHRRVMRQAEFRAGRYNTGYIPRFKAELCPTTPERDEAALEAALIAAALQTVSSAPTASENGGTAASTEISTWRRELRRR
jgi:acetyl-CoA carboxylase biotin carboxylase subunit